MSPHQILNRTITDLLLWSKTELGGLDQAEVSIQLDNGIIIGFPWALDAEHLEKEAPAGSESLFSDLSDIPVYSVNPKGLSIAEIQEAKQKRASSFWGRLKKAIGWEEGIPREYRIDQTEFLENKLKHVRHRKIVDVLCFENADFPGFLVLDNGYIITEITIAPHGTGMAGVHCLENLQHLEARHGTNYKSLSARKPSPEKSPDP